MEENKTLSYMHMFMSLLNFTAIFFMAGVMTHSIYRICRGMQAKEFLSRISTVPGDPGYRMAISIGCYLLLVGVIFLRHRMSGEYNIGRTLFPVLEIALCIVVMGTVNMGYNGVVLLVMADLVEDFKGKWQKMLFFLCMITLYIVSDYNLISAKIPLVPFEEYLFYYNTTTQGVLKAVKGVLISVNAMVFILYVVILIQNQMQENERISSLNNQLNLANEQLQVMNVQLKQYALESEQMAETRERNRLAREIHDTLGHALTGIAAGIDACLAIIDVSPETTKNQLNRISEVARQGLKDVRRSVNKLRPDALEHLRLEGALSQMIDDMTATTKTKIYLNMNVKLLKFSSDEEDIIYRVIQESITNAIRHGHAEKIEIEISRENQWLTILIQDDGDGCEEIKPGFGLKHMKERLSLLNGTVAYDGSCGFTIAVRIPIRWGEEYD